jgi:radical SAM superfamily enzyme YgiQ (UPF0313 family)
MYKGKNYHEITWPKIKETISTYASEYPNARRVFLADGNALSLPVENLSEILKELYIKFPRLERVSAYSRPGDILIKSVDELRLLKKLGLHMVYMGIESGSERILKLVNKGIKSDEIIEAGQKIIKSGNVYPLPSSPVWGG